MTEAQKSNLPTKIQIGCHEYSIDYVDNPSNVDAQKRQSLWGQIDFWTRTIRVYSKDVKPGTILQTLMHEILHGVAYAYDIKCLKDENNHDQLDVIAMSLTDTLLRNGIIKL